MPPTIPEDLSSLTDEELSALEAALIEFANTAAAGSLTAETIAALNTVAAGAEAARTELAARRTQAEDLAAQAQAALARIRPPEGAGTEHSTTTDGSPGGGTDSAPDPGNGGSGPGPGTDGQAVTAGAVAVLERVVSRMDAIDQRDAEARAAVTAAAGELTIPPLSALSRRPAPATAERPPPILASATPRAAENIEGIAHGAELVGASGLLDAMLRRADTLPIPREGQEPIRALFASVNVADQVPEERMLRHGYDADNWRKIAEAMSPAAVLASGGGCSLFQPYYDIMQISSAERPVRDSFTGFGAQRAGISILAPPSLANVQAAARTVTDGGTTNTSTAVTSATAAFTQYDVGATITGTGIPAGTLIASVQSATAATLTAAATATATGVTFVITRQGSVTFITQAIDAAALGAVPGSAAQLSARKNCLHVTCPSPTNTPLTAISRCIELGNFQARAYPEQEPVWLELMMAAWAQVGESKLLDVLANNSVAATTAAFATLGVARLFPSLVIRAARAFRQAYRVNERLPLHVWAPAWLLDLMVIDLMSGSGFEMEFYSQARQQVADALAEANVNVTWYIDSGNGKGQYMSGSNSRVVQSAGAALAFPSTAFWYLSHEGAYGFLDGGELDFGQVRDSTLNSRNDFQVFSETFEAGFFRGIASWEFASAVTASGSAAPVSAAISGW